MESRKVQRHLPGKFEKTDRGEARRWRGGCRREAEKTGPGRGSDGSIKAKLGPDGRQEEACGHSEGRRSSRGSGWQGATAQVIRRLPARTVEREICSGEPSLRLKTAPPRKTP